MHQASLCLNLAFYFGITTKICFSNNSKSFMLMTSIKCPQLFLVCLYDRLPNQIADRYIQYEHSINLTQNKRSTFAEDCTTAISTVKKYINVVVLCSALISDSQRYPLYIHIFSTSEEGQHSVVYMYSKRHYVRKEQKCTLFHVFVRTAQV